MPSLPLVDTHCHIDLYPDYAARIEEAERTRIATVAVTNTPSVFSRCAQLVEECRFIRPALGLHPELAHVRHMELSLFKELLPRTRFVGEVGLDFVTQSEEERAVQRRVFGVVLEECARAGGKVLTVHSRRAADDVIDMVGDSFNATVILHWFSGTQKSLAKALSRGMYFSVNPAMVRSEAGRKVVDAVPLERLLTETDGPFVQVASRPASPPDVADVIRYLAGQRGMSEAVLADAVYSTFRHLVRPNSTAK